MALFDVPGWSVPSAAPSQSSQKRKRPANTADKIQSASMNMDKLMVKLRGEKGADGDSPHAPKRRKRSGSDAEEKGEGLNQSRKGNGVAEWGSRRKEKPSTSTISRPKKMKAKKDATKSVDKAASMPSLTSAKSPVGLTNFTFKAKSPPGSAGLTLLQKDMKQSLDGARFR